MQFGLIPLPRSDLELAAAAQINGWLKQLVLSCHLAMLLVTSSNLVVSENSKIEKKFAESKTYR